jgi:hypothetical protein
MKKYVFVFPFLYLFFIVKGESAAFTTMTAKICGDITSTLGT